VQVPPRPACNDMMIDRNGRALSPCRIAAALKQRSFRSFSLAQGVCGRSHRKLARDHSRVMPLPLALRRLAMTGASEQRDRLVLHKTGRSPSRRRSVPRGQGCGSGQGTLLREQLKHGARPASHVIAAAETTNISERSLVAAADAPRFRSRRGNGGCLGENVAPVLPHECISGI
jgi:hypothetical protein